MTKIYTIKYTEAGLAYVRRLLGLQPYDEVGQLVMNHEIQKGEQDKPAEAAPADEQLAATPAPRAKKKGAEQAPAVLNGSGAAQQADAAH